MRYWLAMLIESPASPPPPSGNSTAPSSRWIKLALLVTLGILLLGFAFAADAPVRSYVDREGKASHIHIASLISDYSEPQWLFAICAVGWVAAKLLRRPDWQRRWLIILAATMIAGIMVNIPRSLTGRARPKNPVEQGWFGPKHNGQWLIGRNYYNSFPSGHTTTAAGFAFTACFCFRRLGWLAILGAASVGWSRIWVSAHHFSDVAVGMLFGALLAWCIWRWLLDRGWVEENSGAAPPTKVSA